MAGSLCAPCSLRSCACRGPDGGGVAPADWLSRRSAPIGDPLTCARLLISRQCLSRVDNGCRLTRMVVVLCNRVHGVVGAGPFLVDSLDSAVTYRAAIVPGNFRTHWNRLERRFFHGSHAASPACVHLDEKNQCGSKRFTFSGCRLSSLSQSLWLGVALSSRSVHACPRGGALWGWTRLECSWLGSSCVSSMRVPSCRHLAPLASSTTKKTARRYENEVQMTSLPGG